MVRLGPFTKPHSIDKPPTQHLQLFKSNPSVPALISEPSTTRTEFLATTTSTHFFTLPTWTKRVWTHQDDSSKVNSGDTLAGTQTMWATSNTSLMVNKKLPPTPPPNSTNQPLFGDSGKVVDNDGEKPTKDRLSAHPTTCLKTSYASDAGAASSSTDMLARASLSVGLPHILPSASSSSSSINIIPASTSQPLSTEKPSTARGPRKSRSAQRLRTILTPNRLPPSPQWLVQEATTTPGLDSPSVNSLIEGFSSNTTSRKGKERALEPQDNVSSSQEIKSRPSSGRRSLFWTRKKSEPSLKSGSLEIEVQIPPVPPRSSPTTEAQGLSLNLSPGQLGASGLARSRSLTAKLNPPNSRSVDRRPMTADGSVVHTFTSPPVTPPLPLLEGLQQVTTSPAQPSPRQRADTNPSLLNRLSLSINRLSTSSSFSSPWTPLTQSPSQLVSGDDPKFPPKRHSGVEQLQPYTSSTKSTKQAFPSSLLAPKESEAPQLYLERVRMAVGRAEIAGILASSTNPFHMETLNAFMKQFSFEADPLDVALRKLLMEAGLPRETQQIDRLMEAFARRYLECNPGLFAHEDHPYILSFSLIMLHTDHFNKSNKRKMTKPDYVKNTRLPGVAPEVLDYFFDNIVFAPFIFIEDYMDATLHHEPPLKSAFQPLGPSSVARTGRVDPYYLISQNLLDPLRLGLTAVIPNENPLQYHGTSGPWDEGDLRQIFANASDVEFHSPDTSRSPFFARVSGTGSETLLLSSSPSEDIRSLKLAQAGILNIKDDVLPGGKKSNSKRWRACSVALAETHLLFFRDSSLTHQLRPFNGQVPVPRSTVFRPDEALVLKEMIALYDTSSAKHEHTFRLIVPNGRQILLQAQDEAEMNAWIAGINYASAFCTAGVRMRPLDLTKADVELTGVAAAASHLQDLHHRFHSSSSRLDLTTHVNEHEQESVVSSDSAILQRVSLALSVPEDVDPDVPTAPEIEGADLLKATFDQVKADLAAGRRVDLAKEEAEESFQSSSSSRLSMSSLGTECPSLSTRAKLSIARIKQLDHLIADCEANLAPSLRDARNLAILTPFRKDTRDRLALAAQHLANRILRDRIELTRLNSHRYVLLADLSSEERSWHRTKTLALQVATETLHERQADSAKYISRENISQSASDDTQPPTNASQSGSHRPPSLIAESFYSALDFVYDSPTEQNQSPSCLVTHRITNSPERSPPTSPRTPLQPPDSRESIIRDPSHPVSAITPSRTSSDSPSHERFYTAPESPAEEAEEWSRTRCAQRVSLVRVPSEMHLLNRFRQSNGQMTWTIE